MADHILKAASDFFGAGRQAGDSLQTVQNRLKSLASLDGGIVQQVTMDSVNLGNSESFIAHFIAPFKLEITAILAVKQASVGTGVTATLVNRDAANNTDKNPLSGTNIDMDALTTANEAESQTLSATAANITMEAGDCLKCTFAADGTSTLTGAAVALRYKPIG